MVEELGEDVDGDPGVGVPSGVGVGVPVGVEHDFRGVERGPVGGAQRPEAGDPFAVPFFEPVDGDVLGAAGVALRGREQARGA
jgi:hypothetical protein